MWPEIACRTFTPSTTTPITKTTKAMKNETKNQEVVALVNAAFDKDGFLIRKGMKARQKAARAFLDGDVSFYGQTVNGYDTHGSLLIIAYPNATI